MKKNSIGIIGGGRMGGVLASILWQNGYTVRIFDVDAKKCTPGVSFRQLVSESKFLILCVPSWELRKILIKARPHLKPDIIIISVAKGLEKKTGDTVDAVLQSALPRKQQYATLLGPTLAEEMAKGGFGIGVVCAQDKGIFSRIAKLFKGTNLLLEYNANAYSVALASVLKNVYAIAFGIVNGLHWSGNAKGWFLAGAIREMLYIGKVLGANPDGILGTAGLGDLVATGFNPYSRNYQFGKTLIETGQYARLSEGFASFASLKKLLGKRGTGLPILSALTQVLLRKQNAKIIFENLLP